MEGDLLIRRFPGMGGPWQVARGGATRPVWGRDGRRLFYRFGNDVMEVPVERSPDLRIGTPRALFSLEQSPVDLADTPALVLGASGDTFVMVRPVEPPPGIVVVQNWLSLVEQ